MQYFGGERPERRFARRTIRREGRHPRFTMALAQEYTKGGTLNTVSPGYIGTAMVNGEPSGSARTFWRRFRCGASPPDGNWF